MHDQYISKATVTFMYHFHVYLDIPINRCLNAAWSHADIPLCSNCVEKFALHVCTTKWAYSVHSACSVSSYVELK